MTTRAEFTDGGPALTLDDIRRAADETGVTFPESVVALYMRVNGGVPINPRWTNDANVDTLVNEFLPVRYPTADGRTLESTCRRMRAQGVLDDDLVPFAVDDGGNFFCFEAAGPICFTATDTWRDGLTPAENRVRSRIHIAGSMEEFLDRLAPEPSY